MSSTNRFSVTRCIPAFVAALLLVYSSASHIHLRYCLDGDEAPISVHFESKESHSSDQITEGHGSDKADIEAELSLDFLLAKLAKHTADSSAVLSDDYSFSLTKYSHPTVPSEQVMPPRHPESLLPPSRAPPRKV